MHLVLIDNLLYNDFGNGPEYDLQPHAGLMSLVAIARAAGHAAEILDPKWELASGRLALDRSLYPNLADDIEARDPDVVGFTALGCNFPVVVRLARELKRRRPDLPILLGGPHASILDREILDRLPEFDVVVRHEAERTLPELLDRLDCGRFAGLPAISYRSPRGDVVQNPGKPLIEELDELPFPAYDAYALAPRKLAKIQVEAGRGCPFSCTFCSTATFFGRRYRLKSAARLVAEMDWLHETYGYTSFSLTHDLFTVNRKKIFEFCEAVRDRGYEWRCSARVDCVDPDLLRAMAKAGCCGLYFGIETGSARMQAISCKRLDLDLVEPTVALASSLGMETITSFITGYPEEEAVDQTETLDMVARLALRPDGTTTGQLHMLTPEPGTGLIEQYGERMRFDGYATDCNFPLLDPLDREIVESSPELFPNYHYYPTVLERERHIFAVGCFTLVPQIARAVLRYLLRRYDNRFSLLVEAADAWRRERGLAAAAAVNLDFLIDFAAAEFGADHHVVSLLRYAAAVHEVRQAAKAARGDADMPERRTKLTLARRSRILFDIHDCPELLAAIARAPGEGWLSAAEVGGSTCLLVKSDPANDEIATFRIDRSLAATLSRFANPKGYAEFRRELTPDEAPAGWSWRAVRGLCADGVLEPA